MLKLNKLLESVDIEYNDNDHTYRRKTDGVLYPSCSKIAGMLPKEYLMKWTTKENYLYMVEHWDISRTYTEPEKMALLLLARDSYAKKQQDSLSIGSKIHDWIEKHIKGENAELLTIKEEANAISSFLEWEDKNIKEWIGSELLVVSNKHRVAGRLDAVAVLKNGESALIDFKTSNEISIEYNLQTAGYWMCLDEMGFTADKRMVLRIPKSLYRKRYDKTNNKYIHEKNVLEEHVILSDINEDMEVFKSLLLLNRWKLKYE